MCEPPLDNGAAPTSQLRGGLSVACAEVAGEGEESRAPCSLPASARARSRLRPACRPLWSGSGMGERELRL